MSQRTRARTTGAAAKPTNRVAQADELAADESGDAEQAAPRRGKRPSAPTTLPASAPASLPLQPEALARALRAVAMELERDPALAERVAQAINDTPATPATPATPHGASGAAHAAESAEPAAPTIGRSFRPSIVTGVAETLGPGVPDPFALRQQLGEPGLREALASLRLGSLRAIIRQHKLDSSGNLSKLNDAEKLRAHILAATRKGRA